MNGSFLFGKPPKERWGFSKRKVEWSWLTGGGWGLLGFDFGAQFPEERAQFTGNGHLDLVVMELTFSQCVEAMAQAGLGSPGEFLDPSRCGFLACGKLSADFRRNSIVGSLFDEDPACVRVTAFTDSALSLGGAARVLSGHEP